MAEIIKSEVYQITVEGQLSPDWLDWFDQISLHPQQNGTTILKGTYPDQPALHAVLNKVRDLGLIIVSMERIKRRA
jgi:hypothetical protein